MGRKRRHEPEPVQEAPKKNRKNPLAVLTDEELRAQLQAAERAVVLCRRIEANKLHKLETAAAELRREAERRDQKVILLAPWRGADLGEGRLCNNWAFTMMQLKPRTVVQPLDFRSAFTIRLPMVPASPLTYMLKGVIHTDTNLKQRGATVVISQQCGNAALSSSSYCLAGSSSSSSQWCSGSCPGASHAFSHQCAQWQPSAGTGALLLHVFLYSFQGLARSAIISTARSAIILTSTVLSTVLLTLFVNSALSSMLPSRQDKCCILNNFCLGHREDPALSIHERKTRIIQL